MFAEVSIKKHPKVSTKILDIVKKNAENHQKIAHKSPNSLKNDSGTSKRRWKYFFGNISHRSSTIFDECSVLSKYLVNVFCRFSRNTKVVLGLRLLVHPPIFYSLNVSYDMCASYVRVLKKSLLRIYSFFFHKVDPLKMLKTWFRDNGQSLGHTFSKAIEIPRSSKIEGRENNFSDTFSASDRDFFFLKI